MPVVLTETYCNKVTIQITQRDDFIQKRDPKFPAFLWLLSHSQCTWTSGLVSLSQISKTWYWTCDGPNRQFHMGRSADQRRWHRTLDSGRMDPAHYEVQQKCSSCHHLCSYRTVNNTHRDKSRNSVQCVVSFRLDCFTVLWTG